MGSCAAPSAKGDDKFITTDYLQQCQKFLPPATAPNTRACRLHRLCPAWLTRGFTWQANRRFIGSCASMGKLIGAVVPNRPEQPPSRMHGWQVRR
ncbi:hypothetical protein CXA10_24100 [Salmonella enterica subsp. enterica serovar Infantis]|uniref:DNA replication protein n=1 Tax=Salmonella infantis TaxID=595 RepID=A0A638SWQ3_SALIN|nr:hypothetical protein [Salmonella enterica subsp. enterica serovar Infantis]EDH4529519.1 hypothetical protein [Salmonella enterica]EDJ7098835.1 hypothetical protein [Salmonella enterica subsp. enterica serovar Virchow]EDK1205687.1 hypothetical protein [Salmonella enterica subsp. enterica]EDH4295010.1 hypothetical protein [Salmonella enterica subsp. enterica serovar Infantis]